MEAKDSGLIKNWLRHIRDVARLHNAELQGIPDEELRFRRLVELHVQEQCLNLFKTGESLSIDVPVYLSYSAVHFPNFFLSLHLLGSLRPLSC